MMNDTVEQLIKILKRPTEDEIYQKIDELSYFHKWQIDRIDLVLDYYGWSRNELNKD